MRGARFLGSQIRFRVERRRLPPNCDQRCAFQHVSPCQWGLPPRIQRALKTAGCSPSEGARFASAEALARAWFSLPLCDILRSVSVGVSSTVALRTSKVVAITGSHRTTRRTPLTGMGRIDLFDADTSAFGFVRDELVELVEVPRMDTRPRTSVSDDLNQCGFSASKLWNVA